MPKICKDLSVLMSVYKAEKPKYLDMALASVFGQTLKAGTVVLVKDGLLTPELDAVIDKWQKAEDSLTVISYENNKGLAVALNTGLNCIHTEFIARMDTDDICLPERFEKQVLFMKRNAEIDVIGTYISEIDENNHIIKDVVEYPITHEECYKFFQKRDPLAHPTVMFRKSFFYKINGFYDETRRKNQDTKLWHVGFLNNCKLSNIPEVLLQFRRTSELLGRRSNFKDALRLFKEHIKKNKDLNYGFRADIYSFLYFCFSQMPCFIRRFAYQYLR